MALRPGLRMIDPTTMPIDKMPIERLKEVVPGDTLLGKMLAELPDTSLQSSASPNDGLEQVIDLIGVPDSGAPDLF